jgi:hypothetical protein
VGRAESGAGELCRAALICWDMRFKIRVHECETRKSQTLLNFFWG